MEPAIIVNGGVGQPSNHSDGTQEAAKAAMEILNGGGDALDAVVKAVMMLEDDERFNAGTGSRLSIDGSLEMDAIVMDSRGRLGAVAAIRDVKNPVLVARKVVESPHSILGGKGAIKFARRYGFSDYDPVTDKNIERLKRYKAKVTNNELPEWLGNWQSYRDLAHDTVGAIAMDKRNVFAAASSTGGTSIKLPGRISDVPFVGCGIWVGKEGGVIATGMGEAIIEKLLSFQVYNMFEKIGTKEAADWGVSLYPKEVPIGLMTISKDGWGVSANMFMACTVQTWDTTLNGNEIWPPSDTEGNEVEPLLPSESAHEHITATGMGRAEAEKAVQSLIAPEQHALVMPPQQPQVQPMVMPQQPPPMQQQPQHPPSMEHQPPPVQQPPQQHIIQQQPPSVMHQSSSPAPPAPEPKPQETIPPEPAPSAPAPEPQKFRCPYCAKVFAITVEVRPVKVFCPHCSQAVVIQ